jgi:hypothetical protein
MDPAISPDLAEDRVIYDLLEGLTLHPQTGEPMAGLDTHYELTADGLRYTFYLRGHPELRGIRLDNRDDLPLEYSHGLPAAPDLWPARWSDAARLTARYFEYVRIDTKWRPQ